MKKPRVWMALAVVFSLALGACPMDDDGNGDPGDPVYTVSGVIVTSDGGSVAGAQAQLKRNGTAIGSPASAGADGSYIITGVAAGTYTIEASLAGYDTGAIAAFAVSADVGGKNLTLQKTAGQPLIANIVLELGASEAGQGKVSFPKVPGAASYHAPGDGVTVAYVGDRVVMGFLHGATDYGINTADVDALDAAGQEIAGARVPFVKKYPAGQEQQAAWADRLIIVSRGLSAMLNIDQDLVYNEGLALFTNEANSSGLKGLVNTHSAYSAADIYDYCCGDLGWTEDYYDAHLEEATARYMAEKNVQSMTWETAYPVIYDFIVDNLDLILEYYYVNRQDETILGIGLQFFNAMAAAAFNGSSDPAATNDANAADKAMVKEMVNKYLEFYSQEERVDSVA
jgi:hypothetical protein